MSFPAIFPFAPPLFFKISNTIIHGHCHLVPCYSPSSASSPSPSSSSLSSSLLPLSTALPFPFCVDPLPPTLPCTNLPTRPECAKASLSNLTVPIRHSCLASCFQATLSCCLCNLRSACHNSFTL